MESPWERARWFAWVRSLSTSWSPLRLGGEASQGGTASSTTAAHMTLVVFVPLVEKYWSSMNSTVLWLSLACFEHQTLFFPVLCAAHVQSIKKNLGNHDLFWMLVLTQSLCIIFNKHLPGTIPFKNQNVYIGFSSICWWTKNALLISGLA